MAGRGLLRHVGRNGRGRDRKNTRRGVIGISEPKPSKGHFERSRLINFVVSVPNACLVMSGVYYCTHSD